MRSFTDDRLVVLSGDVGGTKTLLQLTEVSERGERILAEGRLESASFSSLQAMVREFMSGRPPADSACFAVAGPVADGAAHLTNLGWSTDEASLVTDLGIARVSLINDFHAIAVAVPQLAASSLLTINEGETEVSGTMAVLGAGTGLGQASIILDGDSHRVVASEGGHCDFAPNDSLQIELLQHLAAQYGHVSYERLLSGDGIEAIYQFMAVREGVRVDGLDASEIATKRDQGDSRAIRTWEIFIDIYGAEAGNLALKVLARGGVFVAGGIAAKNLEVFRDGKFLTAFQRKGRFSALMKKVPLHIITDTSVGLKGATAKAISLASQSASLRRPEARR